MKMVEDVQSQASGNDQAVIEEEEVIDNGGVFTG